MILADTGAIYATIARRDANHLAASRWFGWFAGKDQLCITQPILTESWLLISAHLGAYYANRFWDSVNSGVFEIIDLDPADLKIALDIEQKYDDSSLGFVDATSLAACEKYRIAKVFTFDRNHFSIYRPSYADFLELAPES